MSKEIWVHPDRKHEYFQSENSKSFLLCRVDGSLASTICYPNKEYAVKDGWRLK